MSKQGRASQFSSQGERDSFLKARAQRGAPHGAAYGASSTRRRRRLLAPAFLRARCPEATHRSSPLLSLQPPQGEIKKLQDAAAKQDKARATLAAQVADINAALMADAQARARAGSAAGRARGCAAPRLRSEGRWGQARTTTAL